MRVGSVKVEFDQKEYRRLLKNMKKLPEDIKNKAVKNSLRSAGRYYVKMIKSLAPKYESLQDNIKSYVMNKRYKKRNGYYNEYLEGIIVGVFRPKNIVKRKVQTKYGPRYEYNDPYYAHWIEYGTNVRYRRYLSRSKNIKLKKPQYLGRITAQPFMRPAFEIYNPSAFNKFRHELFKRLKWLEKRGYIGSR